MAKVVIVADGGNDACTKSKSDLTAGDVFHGVFVLLITPQKQILLGDMPDGRLSASCMAIRQKNETPPESAARALRLVTTRPVVLHHLGDQFWARPNIRKMYMSVFYGVAAMPGDPAVGRLYTRAVLDTAIANATPALAFIWQQYQQLLPV